MTTEKIFSLEIKKLENIDISTIYEILKTKDRIYKKMSHPTDRYWVDKTHKLKFDNSMTIE